MPATTISGLDSHLGFWLRYVSNHVSGQFKKLVESQGISLSEWVALRELYDGQRAPAELMKALGMTKGAISKIASSLERKGLAERVPQQGDARAKPIVLTRKGRDLVPILAELADRNDQAYFGHLPSRERTRMIALLKQIIQIHQLKQIPVE